MKKVQGVTNSIITKIWHRGPNPPQTVEEKELLWIRYDGNDDGVYGYGVLYFLNPDIKDDANVTNEQVANPSNWIPMSAIYT